MRIRFGRILCATDLSESSNRALPYAALLAKRLGGNLRSASCPILVGRPAARTRRRRAERGLGCGGEAACRWIGG